MGHETELHRVADRLAAAFAESGLHPAEIERLRRERAIARFGKPRRREVRTRPDAAKALNLIRKSIGV